MLAGGGHATPPVEERLLSIRPIAGGRATAMRCRARGNPEADAFERASGTLERIGKHARDNVLVVAAIGAGTAAVRNAVEPAELIRQPSGQHVAVDLHTDITIAGKAGRIRALQKQQAAARDEAFEVERSLALAEQQIERRAVLISYIGIDQRGAGAGELGS